MRWFAAPLFCLSTLFLSSSQSDHNKSQSGEMDGATLGMLSEKHHVEGLKTVFKLDRKPAYSKWGEWSPCTMGHHTRRRHCLMPDVCGNGLRIEVKRCRLGERKIGAQPQIVSARQLDPRDVMSRFIGFEPWTNWTSCSRRCLTVRKRYCHYPALCGKKVVRQSAYCYVEGSFCQRWIRGRMQRRRDPESNYVVDSLPPPEPAIHEEDTQSAASEPICGVLGRYRGPPASRIRSKMREMLRIIGGRPTTPGKWPWQVVVLNRFKEAFCGGTLISLRWVVSAAHCVRKRLYVRLGEYDLLMWDRYELEMRITEAVIHPSYDPDTVVNDVAMLRLPEPAKPRLGHGIACLPEANVPLPPHSSCVILGWGKRRPTDVHGTRVLHEAQVSTIQQGVCRRTYWQYAITDNMVCAGRGRRDSCAGDSGGPLLCRKKNKYYLQGITSFGDGCGKRGKYGIYTRTAGYVPWINSVMNNKYFDD